MMAIDTGRLEVARRLSSIFMPHADKKRTTFVDGGGRFGHYTSAAAGLSIIKTKSIWMRNTTCMADYSEVQHGFERLRSDERLRPLVQWLDDSLAGAGSQAVALFDQWWNDTQYGTFISSIAEHDVDEDAHGRLSMWRAFGGSAGARIAFVLRIPVSPSVGALLNIFVSPVAYFRTDQLSAELDTILKNGRDNLEFLRSADRELLVGSIFYVLISGTVCLKHEGFHEEREWRVVYNPKRAHSPLMTSSIEVISGVPELVYKIPLGGGPPDELDEISISKMLDRIIIGPSPYPWAMYEAFVSALTDAGVENPSGRVFVSGIPLRG